MNYINISLSRAEASLVLSALRHVSADVNFPQLESIIDTFHASLNEGLRDEDEHDQFRTDAEADADALASAGYGTDEDYGGPVDDGDY